ncbi:tyrosine-type recombinase/integrase [Salibacterium halotolerans]|uniref:Phage integrase family protein n=1 Tax=Salibacterium halotolerans TaxID=1884432 RepID=A0A1I5UWS2_9BACI|nr:tyrosine-type recombinase/integrase [Salibacterium halotolerans]SFP99659.1 Phage integrase family protein [Salibacterium halotolerans]
MANEVNAIKSKVDRDKMKRALHGRDRLLFVVGVSLGLRISDLLPLKVGDLRGQDTLYIAEKKTGKRRPIKLNATVRKEVAKLDGEDDEYLFRSKRSHHKPIDRVQAYRILNAAAERAGIAGKIGGIGTHTLRKTHGWMLYENGTDITRIMRILKHSSERETLKYIGIEQQELDEAVEAIEV